MNVKENINQLGVINIKSIPPEVSPSPPPPPWDRQGRGLSHPRGPTALPPAARAEGHGWPRTLCRRLSWSSTAFPEKIKRVYRYQVLSPCPLTSPAGGMGPYLKRSRHPGKTYHSSSWNRTEWLDALFIDTNTCFAPHNP